jgi:lysophospholipase L1-like esterase
MPANTSYSWLALGDSYTIGEGVPLYESYPYQCVQLLRRAGHLFAAPEIIARTGWTTGELQESLHWINLLPAYDIVSLLIGVNNQYRGYTMDSYETQFKELLQQALAFAGGRADRVFVLSIPDWGITPFAAGRPVPQQDISAAIDAFNRLNAAIAGRYGVHYLDITPGSRLAGNDNSLLVADQLHYSGKEYGRWAALLAEAIAESLSS